MGARVTLEKLVLVALERELADHRVDAPTLEAAGDVLVERRPLTKALRSLACACWLAADARTIHGAAEALSPDGDVEAWVAEECARQGVEVVS